MQQLLNPNNVMYLARVLAFLTAIPIHELAHAYISDKLGDHTARYMGRLTLNPIKHLDPWGLLSMLLIGIGWAKPVPVDPNFYKNRKVGMAVTAAAGPLSNLLFGFVLFLLFKVVGYATGAGMAAMVFGSGQLTLAETSGMFGVAGWLVITLLVVYYLVFINITLAIFNLIPIPPLDGSRILGLVLPEKIYFGIQKYEKYIMIAMMAAIFILPRVTGFNPLGWLLGGASGYVIDFFGWCTGWIDMLFGAG